MQVRPFFVSFIRLGLEICEGYFRATTAAKFRAAELFSFPELTKKRFADEPLSSVPAAVEGAIHGITAPLKTVPILGDLLDNAERVAEANVEMNPVDSTPKAIEVPDGEVDHAIPLDSTLKSTDQAGEMVEQASPI